MLEGRFATVQADLARAEPAGLMAQAATSAPTPANSPSPAAPQFRAPELPKNVQPFRSSDGFLLLRGRDAKGNAQLLKLAAPHDLWMHTGGGPGAHILIRRDHAAQEIPSRTISEAAILSVLKSWRKDETQVDVIAAYETVPAAARKDEVLAAMQNGTLDCVTFGSSSTVENFLSLIPADELRAHPEVKLAAIGPVTAKTLADNGLPCHIQPEAYTIPALVEALKAHYSPQR